VPTSKTIKLGASVYLLAPKFIRIYFQKDFIETHDAA
jgi:hypothetical protein